MTSEWQALASRLDTIDRTLVIAVAAGLLAAAVFVVRRRDLLSAFLVGAAALFEIAILVGNQVVAPKLMAEWEPRLDKDPSFAIAIPSMVNLGSDILNAVVLVLLAIALVRLARRTVVH